MTVKTDCDRVFELLTRAPFPSGGSETPEALDHLRDCHECRALAEALRPAVGLFHESLLADEPSLPCFDQRLVDQLARENSRVRGSDQTAGSRAKSAFASAAASVVALGLAILMLLQIVVTGFGPNSHPMANRDSLLRDGPRVLAGFSLPLACLPPPGRTSPARPPVEFSLDDAQAMFSCCADCHRPGGTGPASRQTLAAFRVACTACHPRTATRQAG